MKTSITVDILSITGFRKKRLFEHTGCYEDCFPMNAKRAKTNTITPKDIPELKPGPTCEDIQLNYLPNSKKYPPPKIRKGVEVLRDFPSFVRDKYLSAFSGSDEEDIQTPDNKLNDWNIFSFDEQDIQTQKNESNDWSIVSLDDHRRMVIRLKVRHALNLFAELLKMFLNQKTTPSQAGRGIIVSKSANEAAALLKSHKQWANNDEKIIGSIPGVVLGDRFQYRAELVIIGLHGQYNTDIDYINKDGIIYATSIVCFGSCANANEPGSTIVYSCAYPKRGSKDLIGGTLGLENSKENATPVRVIQGYTSRKQKKGIKRVSSQIYIYNGLYLVTRIWREKVLKFELTQMPDQQRKYHIPDYCIVEDLSQGKENIPIRAINNVDNEKPPNFTYLSKMVYPTLSQSVTPRYCDCLGGCSDLLKCSCVVKNGGRVPFNDTGCIVWAKPIVYECGPSCKCPPSCENRVSQKGIQYELEVFKTKRSGWGLRSRNLIPSGGFVCEYIGEILGDFEADDRANKDEYLFDIGNNYNRVKRRNKDNEFAIDAAHFGNIGRFINHSCSPNMYAQNVFYDHDDERLPHIMFFATKNIKPLQELTYDYNYKIDQVRDSNGNIKRKDCYCGARCCTGRLY